MTISRNLVFTLATLGLLLMGCPPATDDDEFGPAGDDDDAAGDDDDASDDDAADDDDTGDDDDDAGDDDTGDDDTAVECSGHGTLIVWDDVSVCACDSGYSPSSSQGTDCVPTAQICTGGAINYDVDEDGQNETYFEPSVDECWMFELVNYTRATHDDEGTPECHTPLMYDVEWSAHGRNHSLLMQQAGGLYHDDYPYGQNCAYGCDAACEMDMYMNGPNEPHCPELSHHCNIMRCEFSYIGIGFVGTWNTQNFL